MQAHGGCESRRGRKNEQQLQEARNTQMLGHIRTLIREGNEFMAAWQREYEQIAKLLQVYQVTEAGLLKEHLFARYRKLVCDIEERQRQEAALKEKNSSVGRWRADAYTCGCSGFYGLYPNMPWHYLCLWGSVSSGNK